MRKFTLPILLSFLVCLSFSLTAQRSAEINHYPLYKKITDEGTYEEFVCYLGNGETISMWTTWMYGNKGTSVLVKSSGDNPKVKEVKIKGSSDIANSDILFARHIGDEVFIAYENSSKKDEVTELRIARLNPNTLEFSSDEEFLSVKRVGPKGRERGNITVGLSPDKKHFAALGVDGAREGVGSAAKVKTLNLETDETTESPLNFDKSYSVNLSMSEVVPLSNNGAAVSFRIIYPINERRVFKQMKLAAPHEYLVKVIDGNGKEAFSQIVEVEERVITDINIGETRPGVLTIAGWLADKDLVDVNELYSSTGAFSTMLSLTDLVLKPVQVVDFQNDLLGRTRSTPFRELNEIDGYVNLITIDTHIGSDGSFWLVAEEQTSWSTDTYTVQNGLDLLVARVSNTGTLEWVDKLAAHSKSWRSKYSWLEDDGLYVVFKDAKMNESIRGGGYSNEATAKDAMLALGHFSQAGDVSKKHIYDYSKDKKRDFYVGSSTTFDGGIATLTETQGLHYLQEITIK